MAPPKDPALASAVQTLNITTRHHGKDSPQVARLRAELSALKLEKHVREVVAQAPPLPDETRRRIASILIGDAE